LYGDGSNLTNLPAGSPAGLDTQIQFNDGGVFNGDAEFTWNKTTDTLTVTGDISGSGNISGSAFYGDGSNLSGIVSGPGSSVDKGIVTWNGTTGFVLADSGVRNYGSSATDPTTPAPSDGDEYYNTTLKMKMTYDGSRSKWLSSATADLAFGRQGNTGAGAYYRGPDRRAFSSTVGRFAEYDGTVVSITYTRTDTSAATFEITADGSAVATLASAATTGQDLTIDGDFSQGEVLGARNESGGTNTSNVLGWARIRWRV